MCEEEEENSDSSWISALVISERQCHLQSAGGRKVGMREGTVRACVFTRVSMQLPRPSDSAQLSSLRGY